MDEQYFTVEQIAERLQYHKETIRQEIRSGRLRAVRIPPGRGEYRVSGTDLADYLRNMATKPAESKQVENKEAGKQVA